MDQLLNDRLNAISGKLDRTLTRVAEVYGKQNDVLARLAQLERLTNPKAKVHSKRLGKQPAKIDSRTLKLAKYLKASLPPAPSMVDWTSGITSYGMMLNDRLGDCTIAACGHAVQCWTAAVGAEKTIPDWAILDYYEAWDGYVPGNSSSDQGGVEVDVLNNWRKYGFGLRAHHKGADRLAAYADPDVSNLDHVKQAIALLGGVYIGVQLPITAQSQSVWDVVGDPTSDPNSVPGSWGGHAVWCLKYTPSRVTCVTWGGLMDMTWNFWNAYVDECHALISPEFVNAQGVAPSGIDWTTMQQDLAQVTG